MPSLQPPGPSVPSLIFFLAPPAFSGVRKALDLFLTRYNRCWKLEESFCLAALQPSTPHGLLKKPASLMGLVMNKRFASNACFHSYLDNFLLPLSSSYMVVRSPVLCFPVVGMFSARSPHSSCCAIIIPCRYHESRDTPMKRGTYFWTSPSSKVASLNIMNIRPSVSQDPRHGLYHTLV